MRIFLSYAAEDKGIAEPVAFSLRARGHEVFLDRDDLPPGGEYDVRIEKAVEQSQLFIFLISPSSITRGRFTLSELEFARRKWRKADGCVLPVMVQPVEMKEVPSLLKSVTILEPKGNIAVEVASAVEPLTRNALWSKALVYGCLGCVSGALTKPLQSLLVPFLRPEGGAPIELFGVPVYMFLSGIAFAYALMIAFSHYYRFHQRQLLIMIFVLGGFFLAIKSYTLIGHPTPYFNTEVSQLSERCGPSNGNSKTSPNMGSDDCKRFAIMQEREISFFRFQDIQGYFVAGLIGAFITVLGVPIAIGRSLPFRAYVVVATAGGAVAVGWCVLITADASGPGGYLLYIPWQSVVALLVGRSIT